MTTPGLAERVRVRRAGPSDARLRLVVLPHAGAGPSAFRTWPDHLDPDVELVAVHLPGREGRMSVPALDDWATLLDALHEMLVAHVRAPFVLLGHSLGAMIAFELAVAPALHEHGLRPERLVLAGCRAPDRPAGVPDLHTLPRERLLARLHELGGLPAEILDKPRIVDLMEPSLRADLRLADTWPSAVPGTAVRAVPVPLVTLAGTRDPFAGPEAVRGWTEHAAAGVSHHVVPGGHFTLLDHRDRLLRAACGPDTPAEALR